MVGLSQQSSTVHHCNVVESRTRNRTGWGLNMGRPVGVYIDFVVNPFLNLNLCSRTGFFNRTCCKDARTVQVFSKQSPPTCCLTSN